MYMYVQQLSSVAASGELVGKMLLLLFFGSIGSSAGDLRAALTDPGALAVGLFGLGLYIVHIAVVFLVGRLGLRYSIPDLLLGSNANIGPSDTRIHTVHTYIHTYIHTDG
jgi:hypothetical protein